MGTTTDPMASYYDAVRADLASSNPSTALLGAYGAAEAPSIAQTEMQVAQAEQQIGDTGGQLGLQSTYANMMAGNQIEGLNINRAQLGLQQLGTEQSYKLQQQGFQQTAQEQQLSAVRQLQGQVGSSAASGARSTSASKQAQADIGQRYAWEQSTLGRQEQQAAGDYARAQANYGLMAQANGLSIQEVQDRLAYGLQQLGIQGDPSSIVAQAGQAMSTGAGDIGSVLSQAGLQGGLNALSGLG